VPPDTPEEQDDGDPQISLGRLYTQIKNGVEVGTTMHAVANENRIYIGKEGLYTKSIHRCIEMGFHFLIAQR
jgi:hypothetical protein